MSDSQKCDNKRCPSCYPNWKEDEAAARKQAADDKQDCIDCWRYYQKQAEAIVAVDDPIARNRAINAAYAKLWLEDRRFQWAGLAAFASKQVGCGLLNAAEMIGKSNQQRRAYQQWDQRRPVLDRFSPFASPRMPVADQATGEVARKVYQMLAKGNTALFLDIWPLHVFYKRHGLERFKRCLPERQLLRGSVVWPIGDRVPFGGFQPDVERGFEAIDAGNIQLGVESLAYHEQINILQPAMYNDPVFATLMRANQFAWALNFPTSSAREVELVLANQCTVSGTLARRERFSDNPLANLADAGQRMAFVMRAADQFDRLLRNPIERALVENSIYLIAHER